MRYYTKEGVPMEKIGLLLRKGVFPYEYIDSHEKFKETSLPSIEKFYSEYHDLYSKTDVLLLADVWTAFCETSMKYYELDPSHYVSAASLTWDAMLKYTGVKIELFTDMEMHDFAEKAKRDGITMSCRRYFKANNPKCKNFNIRRPKTWLSYVDANNLYGWAMSQYFQIGNYKWEYSDEFLKDPENNKKVFNTILKKRKDATRGSVENIKVKREQFSPKQESYLEKMGKKNYVSVEKLITHLGPRDEYVLHYSELQYYVKLGMVVDEIQKAKNDFEKDFYKLMNNSVFGKTMENVRKHIDIKLLPLRNKKDEKNKDLVGVHMGKSEVTLNKLILVSAAVLGLSKLHMYQFWYDYVKATYGEKATLCYMDTDSFIYGVETEDILKSLPEDQWLRGRTLKNAGVISKFKDECPDYIISEFFGIRAKLYHYVLENGSIGSRHKGISKMGMENTARNNMSITAIGEQYDPLTLLYRECLFDKKQIYAKNVGFRTKDHIISLVEVEKQAASPFDDKRWILSDGKRTLPYERAFYYYLNSEMTQENAEQRAMIVKLRI
uniref:DNA-directed DNA polymerase n=1 Tax=Rhizophagus irregularis (strain DAOM 181602 / DAOM 197198 / MUCL 43194) TaxID=747089 RepID=U9ULN4_RHIID